MSVNIPIWDRVEKTRGMIVDTSGTDRCYYERYREWLNTALKNVSLWEIEDIKNLVTEKSQEATGNYQDYIFDLESFLSVLATATSLSWLTGDELDNFLEKKAKSSNTLRLAINVSQRQAELDWVPEKISGATHLLAITIERLSMSKFPETIQTIQDEDKARDLRQAERIRRNMNIKVS